MANCKNCGGPLNKGNIQVIRKPGKRPFRIHRLCPFKVDPKLTEISTSYQARKEVTLNDVEGNPTIISREFSLVELSGNIEDTGSALQPPQVTTGAPIVVEGVFNYPDPPKYRYFVTKATAEKLQGISGLRAIKNNQVGITIEVLPVPDYQVELNPEALADYVEIEVSHYAEDH